MRTGKHAAPSPVVSGAKTGVFADRQRRTCIQLDRGDDVELIRLNTEEGFSVERMPHSAFDQEFILLMADYPVERAARLYVRFACSSGATEEALDRLALLTNVTTEDRAMATAKKNARNTPATKAPAAKPAAKKDAADSSNVKQLPTKPANKAAAAKKTSAKPQVVKQERTGAKKGESASSMFQSLLRMGKFTDDEIFKKVQDKFNLDAKKRSYVGWYRNHMRNAGEKVADPIAAK